MNIRVFRRGERTDRPAKVIVSKSTAKRLLATGRYLQHSSNAIQEVSAALRAPAATPIHIVAASLPYIPEHMPPVDLPGIHFEEPRSTTWLLAHRSVVFA